MYHKKEMRRNIGECIAVHGFTVEVCVVCVGMYVDVCVCAHRSDCGS